MVGFDLGHLLQGQIRIAKVESASNLFIIDPRGLQCETTLWEIMGWESSDVVRFDLEPLLQGQTRTAKLKTAYNSCIIDLRGLQCETNLQDIVSWESYLLMSDLTFWPSFKVKRWFTGFSELSFWWIQICIGSLMHRSSCNCFYPCYY